MNKLIYKIPVMSVFPLCTCLSFLQDSGSAGNLPGTVIDSDDDILFGN